MIVRAKHIALLLLVALFANLGFFVYFKEWYYFSTGVLAGLCLLVIMSKYPDSDTVIMKDKGREVK